MTKPAASIMTSHYLKIDETTPWVFKEADSLAVESSRVAEVRVSRGEGKKVTVKITSTSQPNNEHVATIDGEALFGQTLVLQESLIKGFGPIRWAGGVSLPAELKIGETFTATSDAPLKAGLFSDHVVAIMKCVGFTEVKLPKWSPLPQTKGIYTPLGDGTEAQPDAVVRIDLTLKAKGLGVQLASVKMYCAYGIGVIRADMEMGGTFTLFFLKQWRRI